MFAFDASLSDGHSSKATAIRVVVDANGKISGPGLPDLQLGDASITARLGKTPRKLSFADSITLETEDNDCIDRILDHFALGKSQHLSFKLENNLKFAAAATAALLLGLVLFYFYGLPATSQFITARIPTSVDDQLGEQVLPELDDMLFSATNIDADQQQLIEREFQALLETSATSHADDASKPHSSQRDGQAIYQRNYRLVFRNAPQLGANALALPDATIVVTDDIVELLSTEELNSVLLHEIGHIEQRHSMRMLVRQSLISSAILLGTGDPGFASSLVLLLPQILLETSHSRELETEADSFALAHMPTLGMAPRTFADAMAKLADLYQAPDGTAETEQNSGTDHNRADDSTEPSARLLDYLSTHPAPEARIERFLEAQQRYEAQAQPEQ